MTNNLPPALALIIVGLLLPLVRPAALRIVLILGAPLAALAMIWTTPDGAALAVHVLNYDLVLLQGTAAGRLFATAFSIMSFTGGLFALRQTSRLEPSAALLYAGSAIGVAGAGDLITVFVFWEIMAIGSTLVIWSAGPAAYGAARRYLMMHLLGGVLLMAGIAGHVAETGSVAFSAIELSSASSWLILAGFLVNAGAPPFSAWLPDAYPKASWSGTVFLSAFTTKTAVFVLLVTFAGNQILIWFGLYMVFYGIIYALLENDMRRILAYSSVNQVGFMVVGIGVGTELALNGSASLAFAHIIFKALMLMSAGSVLYQTGKQKCTDLGGLFHSMPVTTICGIVGALAISAFPLTSGFVSKSMITAAAGDQHLEFVWFLLYAASAGVFLHAGIKFPWFVFFQKDSGLRPSDPPATMQAAMIIYAILCIAIGVFPGVFYAMLPFPVDYVPYTVGHVLHVTQLLLFSGLAFFVLLPIMKRTLTISLDLDWFYRRLGPALAGWLGGVVASADRAVRTVTLRCLGNLVNALERVHGMGGVMARDLNMTTTALAVLIVFGLFLLFDLVQGF
jgi:multicomponent Na+:H+ antiporter subunit D